MPIVSGRLTHEGAVVEVLVGVIRRRGHALRAAGLLVPDEVAVRVLIDTGANVSAFEPSVFAAFGLTPVSRTAVITPSTDPNHPHPCDVYQVGIALVGNGSAHHLRDAQVITAAGFHPAEGVQGMFGRDLLTHCTFQYFGADGTFTLGFG